MRNHRITVNEVQTKNRSKTNGSLCNKIGMFGMLRCDYIMVAIILSRGPKFFTDNGISRQTAEFACCRGIPQNLVVADGQ
jgi:hypothetical protein